MRRDKSSLANEEIWQNAKALYASTLFDEIKQISQLCCVLTEKIPKKRCKRNKVREDDFDVDWFQDMWQCAFFSRNHIIT